MNNPAIHLEKEAGGDTHTHTHTHEHTQELHYDFHVCNAAEAIRKKFTGSCWNVLIQVNGRKKKREREKERERERGEGLKVMLKSGRT